MVGLMSIEKLLEMKREIDRSILDCIAKTGGYEAERLLIDQAVQQIESMTGAGGSTRAYGEVEIIKLLERFDDTRGDAPWPISKWMQENLK